MATASGSLKIEPSNLDVPRSDKARSLTILATVGIIGVALMGLLLRLWILGRQPVTSTGIPGLIAHEILHGHFFAFYWGQNYGGVEPYVVAAMFAVFGQSSFTLGLTPVVLDVVATVLIWRVGRRLFGSNVGVGAALLFWIWPEVYIFDSTVEYGFRFATLVCGLAVMLLTIRIAQRNESFGAVTSVSTSAAVRRFDWLALGWFAGLGWWGSPEIVYYLVPSGIFLGWRLLKRHIEFRPQLLGFAIFGAFVGALPWLWNNAQSHLGSLRYVRAQPDDSFTSHLATFAVRTMPMTLGLRLRSTDVPGLEEYLPGSGRFLVAPAGPSWATALGEALYALALVALLIWIVVLIRRRRALLLVGAVLLYPIFYALSPFSWDWQDGRYGLFIAPLLSLLVASGGAAAFNRLGKAKLALPVAILTGLALTLTAVAQLAPYTPVRSNPTRSSWLTWNSNPNPEAVHLTSFLESAHFNHVWAGWSLSWLLEWESGGHIAASDVRFPNHPSYYSSVANASAPAWLFVEPHQARSAAILLSIDERILNPACLITDTSYCLDPTTLEAFLTQQHLAYRVVHFGPFVVVAPARAVGDDVLTALQRPLSSKAALANLSSGDHQH